MKHKNNPNQRSLFDKNNSPINKTPIKPIISNSSDPNQIDLFTYSPIEKKYINVKVTKKNLEKTTEGIKNLRKQLHNT